MTKSKIIGAVVTVSTIVIALFVYDYVSKMLAEKQEAKAIDTVEA